MATEEVLRQIGTDILWVYATLGLGALISMVAANIVVAMEDRATKQKA